VDAGAGVGRCEEIGRERRLSFPQEVRPVYNPLGFRSQYTHCKKDQEKLRRIQPYADAQASLTTRKKSLAALQKLENLRWLLEEYRVSIFAQELGASEPVSPKLLDSLLAEIESLA